MSKLNDIIKRLKGVTVSALYRFPISYLFIHEEKKITFIDEETVKYEPDYDFTIVGEGCVKRFPFLENDFKICHDIVRLPSAFVASEYGAVIFKRKVVLRTLLDSKGYLSKSGLLKYILLPWKQKGRFLTGKYFHLCGNMTYNYFHFLVESLPKVFDFLDLKLQFPELKLLINYPKEFALQYLEACGVSSGDLVYLEEDLEIEELYIPNNKFTRHEVSKLWGQHVYSKKYLRQMVNTLKERVSSEKANRRVYISRADIGKRAVINEQEFVSMLEKYKFETVTLDGMRVLQQIKLFSESRFIIGPHGAGFSNVIFSDNAVIIELMPKGRSAMTYYQMHQIAQIGGNTHILMEVEDTDESENIFVNISDVEKIVRDKLSILKQNESLR